MTSRPVLMPGGWPPNERERDACARVLLLCNGDFGRIIDAPAPDAGAYAEHIARMPCFESPDVLPLFFITGRMANPDALLVLHSRVHERAHVLDAASWVVCVAPALLSEFIRDAAQWAGIEPVGRGLCTWHTGPRPMLIASWAVAPNDLATTVASLTESGLMAAVEPEHTSDSDDDDAHGAVVGFESLSRMLAAQEDAHERSGARDRLGLRPNPRLRRNG